MIWDLSQGLVLRLLGFGLGFWDFASCFGFRVLRFNVGFRVLGFGLGFLV